MKSLNCDAIVNPFGKYDQKLFFILIENNFFFFFSNAVLVANIHVPTKRITADDGIKNIDKVWLAWMEK